LLAHTPLGPGVPQQFFFKKDQKLA